MSKFLAVAVGAGLGFLAGGIVGTVCGLIWTSVFPPDRIAGGPDAGLGTVLAAGLVGEIIGIAAGIVLSLRWAARQQEGKSGT